MCSSIARHRSACLTLNALSTVDEVLLPLQPHFLALHGLSKLLQTIDLVARRSILSCGSAEWCTACTNRARAWPQKSPAMLTSSSAKLASRIPHGQKHRPFRRKIRRNIRLAEAPSFGQSIFNYAPDSNGAEDYHHLAQELLKAA